MISGIISSTTSQINIQTGPNAGLTDTQIMKIKAIEAEYLANKITQAQEQQQIGKIRSLAVSINKPAATAAPKQAEKESDETRAILTKQLTNLLDNKKSGKVSQSDVNDFITNLKNSLGIDQGTLVDKTI